MRTARRGSGKGAKRIRRGEAGLLAEEGGVCFEVEVDEWEAKSLRDVWEEELEEADEAEPSGELDGEDEFEARSGKSIPGLVMFAARGNVAVVAIGREQRLIIMGSELFQGMTELIGLQISFPTVPGVLHTCPDSLSYSPPPCQGRMSPICLQSYALVCTLIFIQAVSNDFIQAVGLHVSDSHTSHCRHHSDQIQSIVLPTYIPLLST